MIAGCPSSHQPTRIREETLESGGPLQRKLSFRLRTVSMYNELSIIGILRVKKGCLFSCSLLVALNTMISLDSDSKCFDAADEINLSVLVAQLVKRPPG